MTDELTIAAYELPPIPTRQFDRVSIVGFADGHRDHAPWDDQQMEFWGLNRLHAVLPGKPWTRWFELHSLENFYGESAPNGVDKEHVGFLRQFPGPVYIRPADLDVAREWGISHATPFPIDRILQTYHPYFTNSVSWLLALMIEMGFTQAQIYGVDMAQDNILQAEYCVAPESRILTSDLRWVPAEQIKVGDSLVGFDEFAPEDTTYREYHNSKVLAVENLIRPSYRLHMADGTKLVSSAEHRWLVNYGKGFQWWETQDLHGPVVTSKLQEQIRADYEAGGISHRQLEARYGVGRSSVQRTIAGTLDPDKCRSHRIVKVVEPWEEDRSWGAGFLAGAFDGEGHLSMGRREKNKAGTCVVLGYSQRENGMSEMVEAELESRGYKFSRSAFDQDDYETCYRYNVKGGRSEILRFLGEMRPPRLLDKFSPDKLGIVHRLANVDIAEMEYIGEAPVVGITTETGTFVVEGFASHNSEQRPSCEWLIGMAQGKGIEIVLPPGSDLLKSSHLYGFSEDAHYQKLLARLQELSQRKEGIRGEMNGAQTHANEMQARINQLDGSMQEVQYQIRNLVTPPSVAPPKKEGQ